MMPGTGIDEAGSNSASAEIYVTKLGAARRQLATAIRMFLKREDELAIHTVGSAAYGLIKDLKAHRGRDEAADFYLTSVFYVVRDHLRGTLPRRFADDPEAMQWIQEMADQLPITATSEFTDIVARISPAEARKHWNKQNRVANFLKHADTDSGSHVSLGEVDNLRLLMMSLGSYVDLTRDLIWPEGYFLLAFSTATDDTCDDTPEIIRDLVGGLKKLDSDERCNFLASMLDEIAAQSRDFGLSSRDGSE